jgi:hypothetical protein
MVSDTEREKGIYMTQSDYTCADGQCLTCWRVFDEDALHCCPDCGEPICDDCSPNGSHEYGTHNHEAV